MLVYSRNEVEEFMERRCGYYCPRLRLKGQSNMCELFLSRNIKKMHHSGAFIQFKFDVPEECKDCRGIDLQKLDEREAA